MKRSVNNKMSLFESSPQYSVNKEVTDMELNRMVDMLFNQDVDMGVSRDFYDPLYHEKQQKHKELEQAKMEDLKKRIAAHEAQYFTIDAETGERIPNTLYNQQRPPLLEKQSSLAKDLDELGQMLNFDELDITKYLNEDQTQTQEVYNAPQSQPPQPQAEYDPWQTTIECYNMDTGFQPFSADGSTPYTSTDDSTFYAESDDNKAADYFNFMDTTQNDAGSSQGMLDDFNMDMVFGENSSAAPAAAGLHPYASPDKTVTSADYQPMLTFGGNSFSSHSASALSGRGGAGDNSGEDSPSTPASSYHSSDGMGGAGSSSDSMASFRAAQRRNANRDEERCQELRIPFSVETITNCPVEEFNAMLRDCNMSEEQLTLIKDIRRRGKNKVAAQNCRKKKQSELTGLEDEIMDLKQRREALIRDKALLSANKRDLETEMTRVYQEIFRSLTDQNGKPYDPRFYELNVMDDGEVKVIPKFYPTVKYEMNASAAYTLLDLSMKG